MTTDNRPRTPWYPASVKPARPGVYEIQGQKNGSPEGYAMYSLATYIQGYWSATCQTPEAAKSTHFLNISNVRPWRGLARKEDSDATT